MASTDSVQKILVIRGQDLGKNETPTVVGLMDALSLVSHYEVLWRDFTRKTGYQREPSPTRINKLVAELERGNVDIPTAVLLNMRNFDRATNLIEENGNLFLCLCGGDRLQVVDGQHRIEGLKKLLEKDPDRWKSFKIPFVAMLGATDFEEMKQFYVVNSTAKSVRTDLAYDILKQQAEVDPDIMSTLQERGDAWKVKGQTLAERLARESTQWQGRIRFANEPKAETTVNAAGMVASLKTLLESPYFARINPDGQAKVIIEYWRAIRDVLPEAFDAPTEFVLQKATGVHVFHRLLVTVLEHIRNSGKSVAEKESYLTLLREPLQQLQGDTRSGELVQGIEFWRSGPEGAAGSYSSNAGRRVLTAKIESRLPEITVE